MTSKKGQESTPYEALLVIAGLLFNFTIVKMRGPNKSLNPKSSYLFSLKNSCLARIWTRDLQVPSRYDKTNLTIQQSNKKKLQPVPLARAAGGQFNDLSKSI